MVFWSAPSRYFREDLIRATGCQRIESAEQRRKGEGDLRQVLGTWGNALPPRESKREEGWPAHPPHCAARKGGSQGGAAGGGGGGPCKGKSPPGEPGPRSQKRGGSGSSRPLASLTLLGQSPTESQPTHLENEVPKTQSRKQQGKNRSWRPTEHLKSNHVGLF